MTAHATADDRFDPAAFIGLFMITLGLFLGVSIYSANIAIDVPTAAGSCWTRLLVSMLPIMSG